MTDGNQARTESPRTSVADCVPKSMPQHPLDAYDALASPSSVKNAPAISNIPAQTFSKEWSPRQVLRKCNELFGYSGLRLSSEEERLNRIHEDCDSADLAFTNDQYGPIQTLLSVHTEEAIRLFKEIESTYDGSSSAPPSADRPTRLDTDDPDERTLMAEELMQRYWENLPNFTKLVNKRWVATIDEARTEAMWIVLMYRGLCWHQLHDLMPGKAIPSRYWDSKMPVYIG